MQYATNERALVHVVDDDASMRSALEGLFDSVGLQTQTYASAKDFLSANLSDRPGCIVLDVRLPDMNGLEFQTRLSQTGVGIPVVMMTGYGDIPMSVHAMKHGAVDFLAKPFRDQDMLDAVMAAIERDGSDGSSKRRSQLRERFETYAARAGMSARRRRSEQPGSRRPRDQRNHRKIPERPAQNGRELLTELVRMADALKPNLGTRPIAVSPSVSSNGRPVPRIVDRS